MTDKDTIEQIKNNTEWEFDENAEPMGNGFVPVIRKGTAEKGPEKWLKKLTKRLSR